MRQINLSSLLYSLRNRVAGPVTLLLRSDNAAINAARAAACRFAASRLRKRRTSWATRAANALEVEATKYSDRTSGDAVIVDVPEEVTEPTVVDSPNYPGYCTIRPRRHR